MTDAIIVAEQDIEVMESSQWYTSLVEDCKAIMTEAIFNSRWALVEGYHQLGERVVTDGNYQEYAKGNKSSVQDLARNIGISSRSIYYAMQFYEKFQDVNDLPEGKNITWNKIVTKYLPESSLDLDAEPSIDKADELQQKWGTRIGQVWELGEHRLICGDCYDDELSLVLNQLPGGIIIADPPYGMNLDTDYSKMPSTKPEGNKVYTPVVGDDHQFDYGAFIVHRPVEFWFGGDYYCKTLPDGGSWLVWDKRVTENFDAMIGSAFEIIWCKNPIKREIIRCNNTLFSGEAEAKNKLHPTVKPIKVIEWILRKYSQKGDIIIDPFAGAGTTILACENLGRKCVAVEILPKYVAVTLERWVAATGKQPTRK